MYRHREFRMVETERLTVSEWTSEGKAVDSSEYNRYTYKGDDLTTVLYRNGTTILFATGADKDTVNKVVTALGL